MKPILLSELQAAMEEARRVVQRDILQERPKGFFSVAEYAAMYQMKHGTAAKQLEALASLGKLAKVQARFPQRNGVSKPGVLYGIAPRNNGRPANR